MVRALVNAQHRPDRRSRPNAGEMTRGLSSSTRVADLVELVNVLVLFLAAVRHRLAPIPPRLHVLWAVLTPCRTQADLTLRVPGPIWKCRSSTGYVMASIKSIITVDVTVMAGIPYVPSVLEVCIVTGVRFLNVRDPTTYMLRTILRTMATVVTTKAMGTAVPIAAHAVLATWSFLRARRENMLSIRPAVYVNTPSTS